MQYERWAPVYERIRAAFGYSWEDERAAAACLRGLLAPSAEDLFPELVHRLRGREVVVVGQAPGAGPPPIWRLARSADGTAVIAADGATVACLNAAVVPDVVVTDLDGPVAAEITAQARGARVVVHAHGDNRALLERWVPEFAPPVLATWAGAPDPPMLNFGGFTDGDRAAYLAEAAGARRILLWGFDFDRTDAAEPDPARKRQKLRWAALALDHLATTAPGRLYVWARDGRIEPYGAARDAPVTQSTDSASSS